MAKEPHRIYGYLPFRVNPRKVHRPWSDACRLAQGKDALIRWRALFEPFAKTQGRLPIERCSSFLVWGGQSALAPWVGVGSVGPRPSKRQGYKIMNKEPNPITNDSRGLYKAPQVAPYN